jgi:hypothetical protein
MVQLVSVMPFKNLPIIQGAIKSLKASLPTKPSLDLDLIAAAHV